MSMQFKEIVVELPAHDCDVVVVFPGGEKIVLQARPSNADTKRDRSIYNGSLDFILPRDTHVTAWIGDEMKPSPQASPDCPNRQHERIAKQIVVELPGDYS
jgi:hypothetical protein